MFGANRLSLTYGQQDTGDDIFVTKLMSVVTCDGRSIVGVRRAGGQGRPANGRQSIENCTSFLQILVAPTPILWHYIHTSYAVGMQETKLPKQTQQTLFHSLFTLDSAVTLLLVPED